MIKRQIMFSSDVDGIMNDYPDCFLNFIKIHHGITYSTKEEAKLNLGDEYNNLKEDYRNSSFKFELPFHEDAIQFYKELNTKNIPIIFSTSRQFKKYPHMYDRTKQWLASSGVVFSGLIQKSTDNFLKYNITHHVDDEYEHGEKLISPNRDWDIFILKRNKTTKIENKNKFLHVNSFDEISNYLFRDTE